MIYLDNAATTRVSDAAVDAMVRTAKEDFYNPSATYKSGIEAKKALSLARKAIADTFGCAEKEIFFTSCATESNNWVLNCAMKSKKSNFIISAGEHASVYECAQAQKNKGYELRIAPLTSNGTVDTEKLLALIDENTALVSVIHASNETGVVNDIAAIARAVKSKNPKTLVHSDGVQAFLKCSNSVRTLGVDFYSVSGHKIGAPKGIGALFVSSKCNISPYIVGGGQENGMRSGTENTTGIAALSAAIADFKSTTSLQSIRQLSDEMEQLLLTVDGVQIVGADTARSGFITCFTVEGCKAEIIQTLCSDDGVIIGRGSACSSKRAGNRVLSEMKIPQSRIDGALRISYSGSNTSDEIKSAFEIIKNNINKMRGKRIG